jgi:hypothetical protein
MNNNWGTSVDHSPKTDGRKTMSIAILIHFGAFALAASDTRTTIVNDDGSRDFYDKCKKIVSIPGTNAIAMATGTNIFNGKSFEQLVAEIKSSDMFSAYCDLSQSIKATQDIGDYTTLIVTGHNNNITKGFMGAIQPTEIKTDIINLGAQDVGKGFFAGQAWATELSARLRFLKYKDSQENAINALRDFTKGIIAISQVMENDNGTIGGDVDMVVLKAGEEPKFLRFV